MINYDIKSGKAAEFIHDGEICQTLEYAAAHSNDLPLIEQILQKAAEGRGLSHREAAVLVECRSEQMWEQISAKKVQKSQVFSSKKTTEHLVQHFQKKQNRIHMKYL